MCPKPAFLYVHAIEPSENVHVPFNSLPLGNALNFPSAASFIVIAESLFPVFHEPTNSSEHAWRAVPFDGREPEFDGKRRAVR